MCIGQKYVVWELVWEVGSVPCPFAIQRQKASLISRTLAAGGCLNGWAHSEQFGREVGRLIWLTGYFDSPLTASGAVVLDRG